MGDSMKLLVLVVITLGAVYTVIPDFFLHRLGLGSWMRQYSPGVALTFDDGPGVETTFHILDILEEYQVTATFFVTGKNAQKYPQLVREILTRGHQIGAHSMTHRYAWFMSPLKTWRDWDECVNTIEQLTMTPIRWVRPPWGTFNLVTWLWVKFRRKRAVLWNVEGHDWQQRRRPEEIAARVVKKAREGSIIVLHDAGGETGAPANTLAALPLICRGIIEGKKLPIVMLEFPQWPWWRRTVYALWENWEQLFAKIYHVERINSTNFLRLAKTVYTGPNLYADDGCLLAKDGDLVAEIHFDNPRIQGKDRDILKIAIRALHMARQALPELAQYVAENPEYQQTKVFIGFTLKTRGIRGMGFQVQEVPLTALGRGVGFLQRIIRWVYHPVPGSTASRTVKQQPQIVWISREALLEKWLPHEQ